MSKTLRASLYLMGSFHLNQPDETKSVKTFIHVLRLAAVIVIVAITYTPVVAQPPQGASYAYLLKANYYLDNGNTVLAADNYNKVLKIDPNNTKALIESAHLYYCVGQLSEAYSRFKSAAKIDLSDFSATDLYGYIKITSELGKTEELPKLIDNFNQLVSDAQGDLADSVFYILNKDLTTNQQNQPNSLILKDSEKKMISQMLPENYKIQTVAVADEIGKLFFTASDDLGKSPVRAYECTYPLEGKRIKPDELDLRPGNLEIRELAVDEKGTRLVFSSVDPDQPTGYNLYQVIYDGKKWSRPEPLGQNINTSNDERYPYFHDDKLYFSSNKAGGVGGFDIYVVDPGNTAASPLLLPMPINSKEDDLQFILSKDGDKAILLSDRESASPTPVSTAFSRFRMKQLTTSSFDTTQFRISRGFTAWTSNGNSVRLFENDAYFFFNFTPGVDYTLITEHDRYFEDKTVSSNSTRLEHTNIYTFHIKNSSGLYSEASKEENLSDNDLEYVHIEPGDLITFQLLPDPSSVERPGKTMLQVLNESTYINVQDTIVFSYIVEADPQTTTPVTAGLNLSALKSDTSEMVVSNKELNAVIAPPTIQVGKPGAIMSEPDVELNFDPNREFSLATVNTEYSQERTSKPQKRPKVSPTVAESAREKADTTTASTLTAERTYTAAAKQDSVDVSKTYQASTETPAKTASKNPVPEEKIEEKETTLITANQQETIKERNSIDTAVITAPVDNSSEVAESGKTIAINTNASLLSESDKQNEMVAAPSNVSEEIANDLSPVKEEPKVITEASQKKSENVLSPEATTTKRSKSITETDESRGSSFPVVFRVQIAAAKTPLSDGQTKRIYDGPRVVTNLQLDGYYKYFVAETPDYAEAKEALRTAGVTGAFISAYKGKNRVSLKEGIRLNEETKVSTNTYVLSAKDQKVNDILSQPDQSPPSEEIKEAQPQLSEEVGERKTEPVGEVVMEVAKQKVESFEFRVQIAASKSQMTEAQIQRIYSGPLDVRYFTEAGYYKYYIAAPSTFAAAKEILNASGVKGAFISAYKGDEKWKLTEAIKAVNQ